jgi:predicted acyltransferase
MTAAAAADPSQPLNKPGRLLSIDALRGFDMFWILGIDEVLLVLREAFPNPVTNFLAAQVTHSDWAGITPYDLIFPLFIFLAGLSAVFSLNRILQSKGRGAALRRIFIRSLLLYTMGIIYYISFLPWGQVRLLGVLQRIALGYLFTGLIYVFFQWRGLLAALVILLVSYWALMTFVPVPNVGAGYFSEGLNLANYIDRHYLPLYKWDHDHDPEGLLSTLPAIGTCILGALAGIWIKREEVNEQKKVFGLLGVGLVCLALGYLWGLEFPIIKKIWTSSYVLVAGGYSLLLLALFYQVIEIWRLKKWATPFLWIGSNAITLYMAYTVLLFSTVASWLAGYIIQPWAGEGAAWFVTPFLSTAFSLLVAYILHRRKIFLRL